MSNPITVSIVVCLVSLCLGCSATSPTPSTPKTANTEPQRLTDLAAQLEPLEAALSALVLQRIGTIAETDDGPVFVVGQQTLFAVAALGPVSDCVQTPDTGFGLLFEGTPSIAWISTVDGPSWVAWDNARSCLVGGTPWTQPKANERFFNDSATRPMAPGALPSTLPHVSTVDMGAEIGVVEVALGEWGVRLTAPSGEVLYEAWDRNAKDITTAAPDVDEGEPYAPTFSSEVTLERAEAGILLWLELEQLSEGPHGAHGTRYTTETWLRRDASGALQIDLLGEENIEASSSWVFGSEEESNDDTMTDRFIGPGGVMELAQHQRTALHTTDCNDTGMATDGEEPQPSEDPCCQVQRSEDRVTVRWRLWRPDGTAIELFEQTVRDEISTDPEQCQ